MVILKFIKNNCARHKVAGMSMGVSPIKILIAEFIPAFNKGELAILNGILKSFEILGDVEVAVFSFYPNVDKGRYPPNVKLVNINYNLRLRDLPFNKSKLYVQFAISFAAFQHFMFMLLYFILRRNALRVMQKPLWKIYYEYDVYIICTDEVDCVNGSSLRFSPIYICWLAKLLKKPIVFYANGTNPYTAEIYLWRFHSKKLWRVIAKYLLSIVDLITVREEHTLRFLSSVIGGKRPIYLTADPAFLLSPVNDKEVNDIMLREGIEKSKLLIGVSVSYSTLSSFKSKSALSPATRYKSAVEKLAKFLDIMIERYSSKIIFIPHSLEPYDYRDDRKVAFDIYSLMSHKERVKVIVNEYSAEELKGLMGKLDMFISSRVHAAIGAVSMGTPVLVFSSSIDERPYYILGKMCKLDEWIYNVENFDVNELLLLTDRLLKASNKLREELPMRINYVKDRAMLNGKLLKNLIDSYHLR
jgi:polysaccharide pyruvyl transferase WcaK-like protein